MERKKEEKDKIRLRQSKRKTKSELALIDNSIDFRCATDCLFWSN